MKTKSTQELIEIKKQIEDELENRKNEYVLKLGINWQGDVNIYYIKNNYIKILGTLNKSKRTTDILKDEEQYRNYEEWKVHGMRIDETPVNWLNGTYQLIKWFFNNEVVLKRIDISAGNIYNFENCRTIENCGDYNLLRFEHNLRPILFNMNKKENIL